MTAGSCSSHPRHLVASVSRSDPSRDAGFLASIGGLSTAGTTPRSRAIGSRWRSVRSSRQTRLTFECWGNPGRDKGRPGNPYRVRNSCRHGDRTPCRSRSEGSRRTVRRVGVREIEGRRSVGGPVGPRAHKRSATRRDPRTALVKHRSGRREAPCAGDQGLLRQGPEPKTARSRRQIPLSPVAVEALRAHGTQQKREKLAAGPTYADHGLVFADEIGDPLDPPTVSAAFGRLVREAGLPRITPHGARTRSPQSRSRRALTCCTCPSCSDTPRRRSPRRSTSTSGPSDPRQPFRRCATPSTRERADSGQTAAPGERDWLSGLLCFRR
jgi:hypothetical protein